MYQVSPIPAFNDNYIWLLLGENKQASVVDPGDADVVLSALNKAGLTLTDILITHHHPDHIGGVNTLKSAFPDAQVFTPNTERFRELGLGVNEGSEVYVKAIDSKLKVLELHGHTRDHIGFVDEQNAFVGDTLFSAGCGRLFEGSAEQLLDSLTKLSSLPPETKVYCAHEYTLANLAFAQSVDKNNVDLDNYIEHCNKIRAQGTPTVPTSIAMELKINPFLRCNAPQVQTEIQRQCSLESCPDELETFAQMRRLKDNF